MWELWEGQEERLLWARRLRGYGLGISRGGPLTVTDKSDQVMGRTEFDDYLICDGCFLMHMSISLCSKHSCVQRFHQCILLLSKALGGWIQ